MPTNLRDRAADQQALFDQALDGIRDRLLEVRTERDRRHVNPGAVPRDDWAAQLGASQHLQTAQAALAANAAARVTARARLPGVTTPAQAGEEGDALRDLLVEEAALQVQVRDAQERVTSADAAIGALGALVARAEAAAAAAAARTAWGDRHQTNGDRLRAALAQPPLGTIVAAAAAALAEPDLADADGRLGELLPSELRARAEARFAEAATRLADVAGHLAAIVPTVDARADAAQPLATAVAVAERDLHLAEKALEAYVARSAGRLAAATAALTQIVAHPDLSASQTGALDASGRADAVAAAAAESDLAAAVSAHAAAQRAVDDAIVAALDADPDADPEADPDVIAARDALHDASLEDPLTAARDAYDAAARTALDEWEVEVPPALWGSLLGFLQARRTLQELADQAARDALVTALDDAADALAAALNERDVAWRGDLQIERQRAGRDAHSRAMADTAAARLGAYTRGDGPSGRTAAEL